MTQDTATGGMHQCKALYITNFVEIVYHPSENEYISLSGEYIIIAKVMQPTVDEMHLR